MLRGLLLALGLAAPAGAQTWALPDGRAFVETANDIARPAGFDASRPWPRSARLSGPTDRYAHDVLGGIPRWTDLGIWLDACAACRHGSESTAIRLPPPLVFEDVAPRFWEVSGDAAPEVVVVEAHASKGARLAVWAYGEGRLTRIAATPFIGQANRWLAPVGAADFDGDGQIEVAYVDRPHLAMELVLVRLQGDRLAEVARLSGATNHRIGDPFVSGGLRTCGPRPEAILASPDGSDILAVSFDGATLAPRSLGKAATRANLARALTCP